MAARIMRSDLDGIYLSGSDTESVSGTLEASFLFVTVTAAYYHKWGHSFSELSLQDVTGDGLPDRGHRVGSENSASVQVQRNNMGGANLLTAVIRRLAAGLNLPIDCSVPSLPSKRSLVAGSRLTHVAG